MRSSVVEADEEKGQASEQKISQLQNILHSLTERQSHARRSNIRNTLCDPMTKIFAGVSGGITAVFGIIYAIDLSDFNNLLQACPDFQKQCNLKMISADNSSSCSSHIIKKLCNAKHSVDIALENAVISTELLAGFVLLMAVILLYKNCSLKVVLSADETTRVRQLTGEDLSISNNPKKDIKRLIHHALFETPILPPQVGTPLLQQDEENQRRGCFRRMLGW